MGRSRAAGSVSDVVVRTVGGVFYSRAVETTLTGRT